MKIAVIGGSGLLGSRLVTLLSEVGLMRLPRRRVPV